MQGIWQDLRYGARMLFSKSGLTLIAMFTLALGIGANTAIFSVVNSVLLRPLDYPESERIVTVWEDHTRREGPAREWTSPTGLQDWREQNTVFSHIAALTGWGPTLTEAGDPEMLSGGNVSAEAFAALGVNPILGRSFKQEEDRTGAERVAVISYSLWQRRFSGDSNIAGKAIRLSGDSYTVIGVMPPGFRFPFLDDADVWRPLQPYLNPGCRRGCFTLRVIARLKPDVTIERARAEMSAIGGRIEQQFPDTNKNVGVTVVGMHELIVGDVRQAMLILLLAVGLVLAIACANVANLLLVKAAAREREIAIRAALGAGRWRILRHLLSESLLLALIGGALGVWLAFWLVDLLKQMAPDGLPRIDEIRIDGRVLLFSLGVSTLTGLICGLGPAIHATKGDLNQALRDAGAGGKGSAPSSRLRSALVVAEIAISLTLLIGAGLLLRSFYLLQRVDPGFKPENTLTARIGLPQNAYPERRQVGDFYAQLHERLKAMPGVQAVSYASSAPMIGNNSDVDFRIEGRPEPPPDKQPVAWFNAVGPDYFPMMKIGLKEGRVFSVDDRENSPRVVVISEAMARRYWPGENPVGKRIGFGNQPDDWREIIGIVADVRHFGLLVDARPMMYFSARQNPRPFMTLLLRVQGEPSQYVAGLRREVQSIDKNLAISNIQPMEEIVALTISAQRLVMQLFSAFAFVALLLAALGIYGVMAYSVSQRSREIGIRIALGAQAQNVLRMVVGQGMKLAVIGVVIGLIISFALTRLMKSLLYGIGATDPGTFVSIAALLTAIALLACWIPARRATKVDPMIALRYE